LAADFAAYANDRVFFAFDEAVLSAEARTILDRQADWLGSHPSATIRIEGNADDGGTRDYNLSLGERRADAVRAYLGARGISAARCYTVAYGEAGPSGLPRAQDRGRNARTVVITAAVQ
jgi:peptidoglycan-associated lipoprotein